MRKITPSKGRKHPGPRVAPALVNLPRGVFPARRQTPGDFEEGLPKRDTNLTWVSAGRSLSGCLPSWRRSQAGVPGGWVPAAGGAASVAAGRPSLALRSVPRVRSARRVGGYRLRGRGVFRRRFLAGLQVVSRARVSVPGRRVSAPGTGCIRRGRPPFAGRQVRPQARSACRFGGCRLWGGVASVAVGRRSLALRSVPGPVSAPGRRVSAEGRGGSVAVGRPSMAFRSLHQAGQRSGSAGVS